MAKKPIGCGPRRDGRSPPGGFSQGRSRRRGVLPRSLTAYPTYLFHAFVVAKQRLNDRCVVLPRTDGRASRSADVGA